MKRILFAIILLCPLIGWSQATTGYHRISQVLARAPQSVTAQVVPYAKVNVTVAATGLAATIYSDPGLSVLITPPVVTADLNGNYSYYMPLSYMVTETISSPGQGISVVPNVGLNGVLIVAGTFASPPPIGNVLPNTGAFTTLTSSGGALNGSLGATTPSTVNATSYSVSGVPLSSSNLSDVANLAEYSAVGSFSAVQNFLGGLTGTTAQIGAVGGTTPGTGNFTTLTAQNTNGALNATNFSGVDIGAQVNAAIATLPGGCGEVDIPAGSYVFSTTMSIPRCVSLLGQGSYATILNWSGGGGLAIFSADSLASQGGGRIGQFTLTALTLTAGSVGILNGGDTNGTHMPGTTGYNGFNVNYPFLTIQNFSTAFLHGNNSYWLNFYAPYIIGNSVGFSNETGVFDSGEMINFYGGMITGNTQGAFSNDSMSNQLYGTGIDFNGEGTGGSGVQIINSDIRATQCHFETHHSSLASGESFFVMDGGSLAIDSQSHSTTAGAISLSSPTTLTGTGFLPTDVQPGWTTTIAGAGPAGALLTTTITAYISSTQVTIATPASTAVSGATVRVGVMPALIQTQTSSGQASYIDITGVSISSNFYINYLLSWVASPSSANNHLRMNKVSGSNPIAQWIDNLPTSLDVEIDSYMPNASLLDNNGNPVTSKLNLAQICLAGASTANCIITHLSGTQIYGYQSSDVIKLTPGGVGGATTYTFTDTSLSTGAGNISTNALKIGSNIVLPSTLTGYLGTSGTKTVLGTTAGASGVLTCWKTDGSIGYCSGSVAGVSCTCN